ncbi:unnamed protein product [Paramecium sonneborni]|uniref:Uncharacterized protein n=1 Tax=Paramecium sonneborni TaxID=65129 RepID=A0A8S1QKZ6_9CILI|nr:unnamed protein product [Paramecium sonneborni]
MFLTIYRNHPKKTLLFLIILFGGITYKFRSHLFNLFIQKMQSKLTQEIQLQMEKGQRINTKLDQIQLIVDQFYQNKSFLNFISEILKQEQITNIGNQLKQNKELNQEQKELMYQNMSELFLIYEVSTIILLRKSECLLLLSKIVILTITNKFLQKIYFNKYYKHIQLNNTFRLIIQKRSSKIQLQSINQPKRNDQKLSPNLSKQFMGNKYLSQIEKLCRDEFKKKIIQFQQYYQGQNLTTIQQQSKQLVEHIFKLNKSLALLTFSDYSISYTYQKLDNRIQLIPNINDINNQILIKQLLKNHQVIKEIFYAQESIQNNNNYYQRQLKQSLKIKVEESSQTNSQIDNNLAIIQKVFMNLRFLKF